MTKWSEFFMRVAELYSQRSKDPSTQVGCVIARGKFQISQGYNGLPSGIDDTKERLNNRELKLNLVLHAEENAILWARKEDLLGADLYVTAPPCSRCASKIIQVGIQRVFYKVPAGDFMERYQKNIELTKSIFKEAEVYFFELLNSVNNFN